MPNQAAINYEAFIAWLTLAAVVVALSLGVVPLWIQWREKKKKRYALKIQLASLLIVAMVKFDAFCQAYKEQKEDAWYELKEADLQLFDNIKILLPQMELLKEETLRSFDPFMLTYSMIMGKTKKEIHYKVVEGLRDDLEGILETLVEKKALQRKS